MGTSAPLPRGGLLPQCTRLLRARAGNVAVAVALALPALATLTLGATDIASIMGDRQRMRSIAEAAALSGARNLSVAMSEADAKEHARAMADAMIAEWRAGPRLSVEVSVTRVELGAKAVHVQLDAQRPSLFGDLLPPGGWKYGESATASSIGAKPLCVLAFSSSKKNDFNLQNSPEIRAPECLLHSNGDITVAGGRIHAGQTQATRNATGDISPAPIIDAPEIKDPFADIDTSVSALKCLGKTKKVELAVLNSGSMTLQPGTHCGIIDVSGAAVLRLAPGEHHFSTGSLTMRGDSRLIGEDVVLVFDKKWQTTFTDDAKIDLRGRESGVFAGFVMIFERGNNKVSTIDSTHVERLDGVIYAPSTGLHIGGFSDVARESDWTVIVADKLTMSGNPRLFLNADYESSDLLVPGGVGPRRDAVRLID